MEVIIILLIVGVMWYIFARKKKQTPANAQSEATTDPTPLLNEALEVVNDFLNIGSSIQLFSSDFRGNISCACISMQNSLAFKIVLCDTPNLRKMIIQYPKMMENNHEVAEKCYAFLAKYENCFEPLEEGYVYKTRYTVPENKKQDIRVELTNRLNILIAQSCPLAEFACGGMLFTKGVDRD